MLLTKIWATILAALATVCLAGMFMLSFGNVGGFADADKEALGAATEAGLAAISAQIQSSPVQRAPALMTDASLRQVLDKPPKEDSDEPDLQQVLDQVSDEALLADNPKMSVGIVDGNGTVVASSGIAGPLLQEAVATGAFQAAAEDEESLFSAILGKKLHVVKVSRAREDKQRLVAIQMLDIGAGSLLRRVLGTRNPAGIVRDGKLLGEMIGDQPLQEELGRLAAERSDEAPDEGASQVFTVGEGLDARLGAVGRVPGPAGRGKNGARLAVLSPMTAAAGQRDLGEALAEARKAGHLKRLNWAMLIGLFVVSAALAFYLPSLEAQGPITRLTKEFRGVAQGTQHQIYHDRYGGIAKDLALAAAQAQDALRNAYMTDVDFDDEELAEDDDDALMPHPPASPAASASAAAPGPRDPGRSASGQPHAIDLPDVQAGDAVIERTGQSSSAMGTGAGSSGTGPAASASVPTSPSASMSASASIEALTPPVGASSSARNFSDEVVDGDDVSLKAAFGSDAGGSASGLKPAAKPAAPPPAVAPPPAARPATGSQPHPKESYFRGIYDEFVQTKMAVGESVENFTFEKFARKLAKNTEDLKQRPGVKDVEFSVYVKDGKAALKAKVIKE